MDFLTKEPFAEYRAQAENYLSSHALADFRACPLLYRQKQQGIIIDEDRPAYVLGRAAHTYILEGMDAFDAEYIVGGPVNPKTGKTYGSDTKAFAEWAALQDREVISAEQFELIDNMDRGVDCNGNAVSLLCGGVAEGVVRADYAGIACQGRLDYYSEEFGIVDLKTCEDLSRFEYDAKKYGYIHQLAFYRGLVAVATGATPEVHIVAVEKQAPYRCGVWMVERGSLDTSEGENSNAIGQLLDCSANDEWPTGFEGTRVLTSL